LQKQAHPRINDKKGTTQKIIKQNIATKIIEPQLKEDTPPSPRWGENVFINQCVMESGFWQKCIIKK